MISPYSRLQSRYQRKSQQKIILSFIGSAALLIVLFVFGLPTIFNLTATISSIRNGSNSTVVEKGVIPTTPRLSYDLTATSSARATVRGIADPKATVELFQNDRLLGTIIAGDDGIFTEEVDLEKGQNVFIAVAVNESGQKSGESAPYSLTLFSGQPQLEISSPKDGDTFKNQTLAISGKTDPGNSVSVNDRLAIVDKNGNFSYSLELSNGDNKLKIIASDPAGNSTTSEITIKYSP